MSEHHAYLCRTGSNKIEVVQPLIEELKVSDIRHVSVETIGINDARSIIQYASVRPVSGSHQLVVVSARSIRVEAQHALLKILEEPPSSSLFIICVPSDCYLLPTLLSRLQEYNLVEKISDGVNVEFESFCKLSYKERIDLIKKRLDKKDAVWVEEIKRGLLLKLSSADNKQNTKVLSLLAMVAENLNSRGASNKFLLEELSLSLSVKV